jgi:ApbE superfamily uncharacterized protein (UPF0280 family)
MKFSVYQERFYRSFIQVEDLKKIEITVEQTDILFLLDKEISKDFLRERIIKYRKDIQGYIKRDKRFLASLEPLDILDDAPEIVKEMSKAARLAGVGPMAAVAGGICDFLGRDLLNLCSEVIIENGGDIFLRSERPRVIGIYAGNSSFSGKVGIKIESEGNPVGICTSSGRIGHSLSFGNADSVTIISDRATLADSVATQTANLVKKKDDIKKAIGFAKNVRGVKGAVIIIDDVMASFGEIQFV